MPIARCTPVNSQLGAQYRAAVLQHVGSSGVRNEGVRTNPVDVPGTCALEVAENLRELRGSLKNSLTGLSDLTTTLEILDVMKETLTGSRTFRSLLERDRRDKGGGFINMRFVNASAKGDISALMRGDELAKSPLAQRPTFRDKLLVNIHPVPVVGTDCHTKWKKHVINWVVKTLHPDDRAVSKAVWQQIKSELDVLLPDSASSGQPSRRMDGLLLGKAVSRGVRDRLGDQANVLFDRSQRLASGECSPTFNEFKVDIGAAFEALGIDETESIQLECDWEEDVAERFIAKMHSEGAWDTTCDEIIPRIVSKLHPELQLHIIRSTNNVRCLRILRNCDGRPEPMKLVTLFLYNSDYVAVTEFGSRLAEKNEKVAKSYQKAGLHSFYGEFLRGLSPSSSISERKIKAFRDKLIDYVRDHTQDVAQSLTEIVYKLGAVERYQGVQLFAEEVPVQSDRHAEQIAQGFYGDLITDKILKSYHADFNKALLASTVTLKDTHTAVALQTTLDKLLARSHTFRNVFGFGYTHGSLDLKRLRCVLTEDETRLDASVSHKRPLQGPYTDTFPTLRIFPAPPIESAQFGIWQIVVAHEFIHFLTTAPDGHPETFKLKRGPTETLALRIAFEMGINIPLFEAYDDRVRNAFYMDVSKAGIAAYRERIKSHDPAHPLVADKNAINRAHSERTKQKVIPVNRQEKVTNVMNAAWDILSNGQQRKQDDILILKTLSRVFPAVAVSVESRDPQTSARQCYRLKRTDTRTHAVNQEAVTGHIRLRRDEHAWQLVSDRSAGELAAPGGCAGNSDSLFVAFLSGVNGVSPSVDDVKALRRQVADYMRNHLDEARLFMAKPDLFVEEMEPSASATAPESAEGPARQDAASQSVAVGDNPQSADLAQTADRLLSSTAGVLDEVASAKGSEIVPSPQRQEVVATTKRSPALAQARAELQAAVDKKFTRPVNAFIAEVNQLHSTDALGVMVDSKTEWRHANMLASLPRAARPLMTKLLLRKLIELMRADGSSQAAKSITKFLRAVPYREDKSFAGAIGSMIGRFYRGRPNGIYRSMLFGEVETLELMGQLVSQLAKYPDSSASSSVTHIATLLAKEKTRLSDVEAQSNSLLSDEAFLAQVRAMLPDIESQVRTKALNRLVRNELSEAGLSLGDDESSVSIEHLALLVGLRGARAVKVQDALLRIGLDVDIDSLIEFTSADKRALGKIIASPDVSKMIAKSIDEGRGPWWTTQQGVTVPYIDEKKVCEKALARIVPYVQTQGHFADKQEQIKKNFAHKKKLLAASATRAGEPDHPEVQGHLSQMAFAMKDEVVGAAVSATKNETKAKVAEALMARAAQEVKAAADKRAREQIASATQADIQREVQKEIGTIAQREVEKEVERRSHEQTTAAISTATTTAIRAAATTAISNETSRQVKSVTDTAVKQRVQYETQMAASKAISDEVYRKSVETLRAVTRDLAKNELYKAAAKRVNEAVSGATQASINREVDEVVRRAAQSAEDDFVQRVSRSVPAPTTPPGEGSALRRLAAAARRPRELEPPLLANWHQSSR